MSLPSYVWFSWSTLNKYHVYLIKKNLFPQPCIILNLRNLSPNVNSCLHLVNWALSVRISENCFISLSSFPLRTLNTRQSLQTYKPYYDASNPGRGEYVYNMKLAIAIVNRPVKLTHSEQPVWETNEFNNLTLHVMVADNLHWTLKQEQDFARFWGWRNNIGNRILRTTDIEENYNTIQKYINIRKNIQIL